MSCRRLPGVRATAYVCLPEALVHAAEGYAGRHLGRVRARPGGQTRSDPGVPGGRRPSRALALCEGTPGTSGSPVTTMTRREGSPGKLQRSEGCRAVPSPHRGAGGCTVCTGGRGPVRIGGHGRQPGLSCGEDTGRWRTGHPGEPGVRRSPGRSCRKQTGSGFGTGRSVGNVGTVNSTASGNQQGLDTFYIGVVSWDEV
jgi:hypothetical protein